MCLYILYVNLIYFCYLFIYLFKLCICLEEQDNTGMEDFFTYLEEQIGTRLNLLTGCDKNKEEKKKKEEEE